MVQKITLEHFLQIKNELNQILRDLNNFYLSNENNSNIDLIIDEKFYKPYMELQDHLLRYDLSDIPFEIWNDIELLSDKNHISDDLKQRIYEKKLTLDDLLNNQELFKNIQFVNFIDMSLDYAIDLIKASQNIGSERFDQYLKIYPEVFNYIFKGKLGKEFAYFSYSWKTVNLETAENKKEQLLYYLAPFFLTNYKLLNKEQLMLYDSAFFELKSNQLSIINLFGLENIRKFEIESEFFSHVYNDKANSMQMFDEIASFLRFKSNFSLQEMGIDFKNGTLPYRQFLEELAKLIDIMRTNPIMENFPNYDWMQGEFRDNHPEIFASIDSPKDFKEAFYKNKITPGFLFEHKDYIKYLLNKNLVNVINANITLALPKSNGDYSNKNNFIEEYINRYGNEKLLNLLTKYGSLLSNIEIESYNGEIDDEQLIEKAIRKSIYNEIINEKVGYRYLANVPEMVNDYPKIFVNFDTLNDIDDIEKELLINSFYSGYLNFEDIRKYPSLVDILKNKDLFVAFSKKNGIHNQNGRIFLHSSSIKHRNSDLELLNVFGNEKFLELCLKYGKYLEGISSYLNENLTIVNQQYCFSDTLVPLSYEDVEVQIEKIIINKIKKGDIKYNQDAPEFLKKQCPELFLSDDAPEELKQRFYNYDNNYPMTFEFLHSHKEYLPYLKDKDIVASLLRNNYFKDDLNIFFNLFDTKNAVRLGINRAETIEQMLKSHQVGLMKKWYDKTGQKFIPDYVVMQNLKIEEADKFLTNAANWSTLMRIDSFAKNPDARDAMIKIAYVFGVFDQDQIGFKELINLLSGLPRNISSNYAHIIKNISLFNEEVLLDKNLALTSGYNEYMQLKSTLEKEGFSLDPNEEIFSQIYRLNDDGSYTLTINAQSYPKSSKLIRKILETFPDMPIITPLNIHQYLADFKLEYDPEFRKFFLANLDQIVTDRKYFSQISNIQRRFDEIKIVYSNVTLTLDLALSYISNNKYFNINLGNERVAEVAALQNYIQFDFEILQKIYNYGKQRTFSSIPRIKSDDAIELATGKYFYEVLRLDDPRAMSIGFETNCCQRLNHPAEYCMEHSMTSKDGRIFIITNDKNEVVAQSWVWRNKDVICFDNIEVPGQKMWDSGIPKGYENAGIRNDFTDDVLEIYKMAAKHFMMEDENKYQELLKQGKITLHEYEGLHLGKVTAGLGYSKIKGSFDTLEVDDAISRTLPFNEPIKLSHGPYTTDSNTQYILANRNNRTQYIGENLAIYHDEYEVYDSSNFNEKYIFFLRKLELITKNNPSYSNYNIQNHLDNKNLIFQIARNIDLNPDTIKMIITPNFAIVYDENNNKIKIGDLLFNLNVNNGSQQLDIKDNVLMQIRLALKQIASDKEIDVSSLDEYQLEIYNEAINLTDDINTNRGFFNQ